MSIPTINRIPIQPKYPFATLYFLQTNDKSQSNNTNHGAQNTRLDSSSRISSCAWSGCSSRSCLSSTSTCLLCTARTGSTGCSARHECGSSLAALQTLLEREVVWCGAVAWRAGCHAGNNFALRLKDGVVDYDALCAAIGIAGWAYVREIN